MKISKPVHTASGIVYGNGNGNILGSPETWNMASNINNIAKKVILIRQIKQ